MELITLEILRIAKDLVVNEYINMRAQAHNRWLLDSTVLWNTRRIKLPYPDIPPYPNENEILERAKKLMDFVNTPNAPSPVIESLTYIESKSNIENFNQENQNNINQDIFDSENSKDLYHSKSYTIEDLIKKIENSEEELTPERDEKEETSSNIETKEELTPERDEKEEANKNIEFSESGIQDQSDINQTTDTIENRENIKELVNESHDEISKKEIDNKENSTTEKDDSNQRMNEVQNTNINPNNNDSSSEEINKESSTDNIAKLEEEYQLKITETKKELEEYIKNKDKLEKDEHTMTNGKILSALLRKIEELRKRMSDD